MYKRIDRYFILIMIECDTVYKNKYIEKCIRINIFIYFGGENSLFFIISNIFEYYLFTYTR